MKKIQRNNLCVFEKIQRNKFREIAPSVSGWFRFPQAVGDGRVRDVPVLNLHAALSECGERPSAYQAGEIVSSSARPGRHFDRSDIVLSNRRRRNFSCWTGIQCLPKETCRKGCGKLD